MSNTFVFNVTKITSDLVGALDDAVEFGKQKVVDKIETSGLGVEWKRAHNGRTMSAPGRVDTGHMRDSVEAEVTSGSTSAEGKFGWINEVEDYFLFQEGGFFHNQANRQIRGMYAIQDASDETMEFLEARIDEVLRDI